MADIRMPKQIRRSHFPATAGLVVRLDVLAIESVSGVEAAQRGLADSAFRQAPVALERAQDQGRAHAGVLAPDL